MDPIQSWLDAKEVRRMAESLMAPAPEVDKSAVDAGYGEDFEGFADAKSAGESQDLPASSSAVIDEDVAPESVKPRFTPVPRETVDLVSDLVVQPEPSAPLLEEDAPDEPMPEEQPAEGVGTSARMVVSHALADAKRMAEGSGMLAADSEPLSSAAAEGESEANLRPSTKSDEPPKVERTPTAPVETTSLSPQVSSPFQLCDDQSPEEDVPIARQIDPSELPEHQSEDEMSAPSAAPESKAPREKVVLPNGPTTMPSSKKPSSGAARGPFLTRLKEFSVQLRNRVGAKAMFLIDNEGQILIDEVGNSKLIQVARTLANASNTASRQTDGSADVGNLHVKIGASATLEVIPCRSRYGLLILGVVCPAPLGAERVKKVAEHLAKTVEPD